MSTQNRCFCGMILASVTLLVTACGTRSTNPHPKANSSQTVKKQRTENPESLPNTAGSIPEIPDSSSPPVGSMVAATDERLMLITPGGPIVVSFHLRIDGEPWRELFHRNMGHELDGLLKTAKPNSGEDVRWKDFLASAKVRNSEFGRAVGLTGDDADLEAEYDSDRNQLVDRSELTTMLEERRLHSSILVQPSTIHFQELILGGPIFQVLDRDADGLLTRTEISRLKRELRLRDQDDDQVLLPTEISGVTLDETQMTSTSESFQCALHLQQQKQWIQNLFWLKSIYGVNGKLRADSFPMMPDLFAAIDTNDNERINESELKAYCFENDDVGFDIRFRQDGATATLDSSGNTKHQELKVEVISDAQIVVSSQKLAKLRLALTGDAGSYIVLQVTVSSDGLFSAVDQNGDGRIHHHEWDSSESVLLALDANHDKFVSTDEIPIQFDILAQRVGMSEASNALTRQPRPFPDATPRSSGPDWFVAADKNRDGKLAQREFLGTPGQFDQLDVDSNGFISAEEIQSEP